MDRLRCAGEDFLPSTVAVQRIAQLIGFFDMHAAEIFHLVPRSKYIDDL